MKTEEASTEASGGPTVSTDDTSAGAPTKPTPGGTTRRAQQQQTTPAAEASKYSKLVEEDVKGAFRPGLVAVMGQIHWDHLKKMVGMASLRDPEGAPEV